MSLRTLLLILGDFSHMVDKMEESGKIFWKCDHNINRNEVQEEINRLYNYIQTNKGKFSSSELLMMGVR
jgi:hypothetical protein